MQAVILAAGRGTRMWPFVKGAKHLLPVNGRPLLEWSLEMLRGLVDEVILVVSEDGDIRDHFGAEFKGLKLSYVVQEEQLGTGHALWCARGLIKGRFLVMNGDDLYSREDVEVCLKEDYAILVKRVEDYVKWGICRVEGGCLVEVVEKPKEFVGDLANVQLMVVDKEMLVLSDKSVRGEHEVTDMLNVFAQMRCVKVVEVKGFWLPVGYPWQLLEANLLLSGKDVVMGNNCQVKGVVKGSLLMDNVVVEEGAVVEGCVLGDGVVVKAGVRLGCAVVDIFNGHKCGKKIGSFIAGGVVDKSLDPGSVKELL